MQIKHENTKKYKVNFTIYCRYDYAQHQLENVNRKKIFIEKKLFFGTSVFCFASYLKIENMDLKNRI